MATAFRPAALAVAALVMTGTTAAAQTPPSSIVNLTDWKASDRDKFYSQDQGSRIMPLRWMQALRQPNGAPFLDGDLGRYGYLPNPASLNRLPVGFTVNQSRRGEFIGMTCAACHTRQIEANGTVYRVDGGPAIVDFQTFLLDLDTAVNTVLTNEAAFDAFARAVLGPAPDPGDKARLRKQVRDWHGPYHVLMTNGLPKDPWGPGRLDAVGMIFNRLTGLDIGKAPSHLIAENIQPAVAPVRYPFLWNAPVQDKTQWPGFAANGNDLLGLARNLGEVYGVFAEFHPKRFIKIGDYVIIDYLAENSANFDGLEELENLIKKLPPPKWPWPVDETLASKGAEVYKDQCAGCHGIRQGSLPETWATPLVDVGSDQREYDILAWTASTGVLEGALTPSFAPLGKRATAFEILGTAVIGTILQHAIMPEATASIPMNVPDAPMALTESASDLPDLSGAFRAPRPAPPQAAAPSAAAPEAAQSAAPVPYQYESRVLEGIWAAAPYLHNGSVPTLEDLLKPASERPASFEVGPAYDPVKVGLAAKQPKFNYTLKTTDCSAIKSGSSRCGHEYGTALPEESKRALLEYLKKL
jgi:hypothetical protein